MSAEMKAVKAMITLGLLVRHGWQVRVTFNADAPRSYCCHVVTLGRWYGVTPAQAIIEAWTDIRYNWGLLDQEDDEDDERI